MKRKANHNNDADGPPRKRHAADRTTLQEAMLDLISDTYNEVQGTKHNGSYWVFRLIYLITILNRRTKSNKPSKRIARSATSKVRHCSE
jgi:hypothetical protein